MDHMIATLRLSTAIVMSARIRLTVLVPGVWWGVDLSDWDAMGEHRPCDASRRFEDAVVAAFDGVCGRIDEDSVAFDLGDDASARGAAACPP
jgi:hypothetical protein